MIKNTVISLVTVFALMGCGASPLKLDGVSRTITPQMVKTNNTYEGKKVAWGGLVIKTDVLKKVTQIEVLAYPLNEDGEPVRNAAAQGRFLINHPGFLEPADYAAGRWISVVGEINHIHLGKVGEAEYTFPVIVAQQLHLWSDSASSDSKTRFHFGIGIRL